MKATPLTPAEIFGNQIRYVVPLFQRPYVAGAMVVQVMTVPDGGDGHDRSRCARPRGEVPAKGSGLGAPAALWTAATPSYLALWARRRR